MSLIDGNKIKKTLSDKHIIQQTIIVNCVVSVTCLVLTATGSFKTGCVWKYLSTLGSLMSATSCYLQCRKLDGTEEAQQYADSLNAHDFKNQVDTEIAINKVRFDQNKEVEQQLYLQKELETNEHYRKLKLFNLQAKDQDEGTDLSVENSEQVDYWKSAESKDQEQKSELGEIEKKTILSDSDFNHILCLWKKENVDFIKAVQIVTKTTKDENTEKWNQIREEMIKRIGK